MDNLLSWTFLLLLTVKAVINTGVQGTLIEPKVPRRVRAFLGLDTSINCTVHTDLKGLKVKWYFCKTPDHQKVDVHSSNRSSVTYYHKAKGWTASYLTISNVSFNDMGWYFCEVTRDIPQLKKITSNGSELVVYSQTVTNTEHNTTTSTSTHASKTPNTSPWWLWVASTGSCALVVTAFIITAIIYRRKKESPVYENTKEAKRQWKQDGSRHHSMMSSEYSNIQIDTLKPHNFSHPNGRRPVI